VCLDLAKLDNGNSHHLLQLEPNKTVDVDSQIFWRYTPKGSYFAKERERQPVLADMSDGDSSGTDSCSPQPSESGSGDDDEEKGSSSEVDGNTPKAAGDL
jgi:hypothetical protein